MRSLSKKAPVLVSGEVLTKSQDGSKTVFKSRISKPIKSIKCVVPRHLVSVMRKIESELASSERSGVEFGLYLKGELKDGSLFVKEEYMLPKQTVSSAAIDFTDDDDGGTQFNGVIHRHPSGCRSFSGVDEEHINANYMFSLLYVDKKITTGIVNIPTEYGRIRLTMDVVVDDAEVDISHLNLDNIQKQIYTPPVTVNNRVSYGDTVRPLNSTPSHLNPMRSTLLTALTGEEEFFSSLYSDEPDKDGKKEPEPFGDEDIDELVRHTKMSKSDITQIVSNMKEDDKLDFLELVTHLGYEVLPTLEMMDYDLTKLPERLQNQLM